MPEYTIMDKEHILRELNARAKNTMIEMLGIRYTDVGDDYLCASMPVNAKVHQPMGLLHGGASAALAETVGSSASSIYTDLGTYAIMGIELSCNHVKSKREGMVYARASILHKGRSTHLWEIRIADEEDRLISHCKLTNIIVPLKK